MAIEIIPDKIRKSRYNDKVKEYSKNWQKKYRSTPEGRVKIYNTMRKSSLKASKILSDSYIRRMIYNTILNSTGEKIKAIDITKEQLDRYKKSIITYRKFKEANKQLKNEKVMKTTITSMKEHKENLAKMTAEERVEYNKQKAREYVKRYAEKKKLTTASLNQLVEASVVGTRSLKKENQPVTFKETLKLMLQEKTKQIEKLNEQINAINILLN